MPTCKNVVTGGRMYCSQYHHKYEFLHQKMAECARDKDKVGTYLAMMILSFKGKGLNTLQPSTALPMPELLLA